MKDHKEQMEELMTKIVEGNKACKKLMEITTNIFMEELVKKAKEGSEVHLNLFAKIMGVEK